MKLFVVLALLSAATASPQFQPFSNIWSSLSQGPFGHLAQPYTNFWIDGNDQDAEEDSTAAPNGWENVQNMLQGLQSINPFNIPIPSIEAQGKTFFNNNSNSNSTSNPFQQFISFFQNLFNRPAASGRAFFGNYSGGVLSNLANTQDQGGFNVLSSITPREEEEVRRFFQEPVFTFSQVLQMIQAIPQQACAPAPSPYTTWAPAPAGGSAPSSWSSTWAPAPAGSAPSSWSSTWAPAPAAPSSWSTTWNPPTAGWTTWRPSGSAPSSWTSSASPSTSTWAPAPAGGSAPSSGIAPSPGPSPSSWSSAPAPGK